MKSCVDIAICIVLPWSGGINPRASKEKSLLLPTAGVDLKA
jgi:hypothetical protein